GHEVVALEILPVAAGTGGDLGDHAVDDAHAADDDVVGEHEAGVAKNGLCGHAAAFPKGWREWMPNGAPVAGSTTRATEVSTESPPSKGAKCSASAASAASSTPVIASVRVRCARNSSST